MPHPEFDNSTPFAFAALHLLNDEGQPLFVGVVKATYDIDRADSLTLSAEQRPVSYGGAHLGEPGASTLIEEAECAFVKVATDVVLRAEAVATKVDTTQLEVSLAVGPVRKTVRVFGDRAWVKTMGLAKATRPARFEKIPIVWERAFGGWDRSDPNPARNEFDPRNPVGIGFRRAGAPWTDGTPLPNIEEPSQPIGSPNDRPQPAGFLFIAPHWQPRASLAGTYDEAWEVGRMPRLPTDFDPRFFSAAPQGQVVAPYLRGDEELEIKGVTLSGHLRFRLPGLSPPQITLRMRDAQDCAMSTHLDTLVIDTVSRVVTLTWRGSTPVSSDPLAVRTVTIAAEGPIHALRASA